MAAAPAGQRHPELDTALPQTLRYVRGDAGHQEPWRVACPRWHRPDPQWPCVRAVKRVIVRAFPQVEAVPVGLTQGHWARSGGGNSRAALARQVRARIAGVSGGIASRSRCEASPPVILTVSASPVHQSSRTLGSPMIRSSRGQEVQASAFNAIRRTMPSRSATAATRAGNSVAGSRVRGHHAPFTRPSAVDEGENASRRRGCSAAAPAREMPRP